MSNETPAPVVDQAQEAAERQVMHQQIPNPSEIQALAHSATAHVVERAKQSRQIDASTGMVMTPSEVAQHRHEGTDSYKRY